MNKEDARSNRVLGIVGSPRVDGNTCILVDEVLRGAKDAGAKTDRVFLKDCTIGPCRACDACLKTGVCVQRDDMDDLLERMMSAGSWILGTPIYWWGPSAQFKTFLDRWYAPWQNVKTRETFTGRRVVFVASMGDTRTTTARHAVGMMTDSLRFLDMKLAATVLAGGVNDPGDVHEFPDVLTCAREAGKSLVTS